MQSNIKINSEENEESFNELRSILLSYQNNSFFGKSGNALTGFMSDQGFPTKEGRAFLQFCKKTRLNGNAMIGHFYLRSPGLFEVSFKGLVKMLYLSGDFSTIHSEVILAGDVFENGVKNNQAFIDHRRSGTSGGITRAAKSGAAIVGFSLDNIEGAYAIATKKDGGVFTAVVNQSELMASMPRAITPESVWYKFPGEMAKKTALKRLAKLALLSTDADDVVEAISQDNGL